MSNFFRQQNNSYSNTYNPGWKSHPNFSWNNNKNIQKPPPPGFQQNQQQPPEKKSSLEDALTQLSMTTQQLSMTTQQFITKAESTFQNQVASIKNLETQVGQLANMMNTRPQGALPSNTKQNPKGREQVKAITLRNGRELEEPIEKSNSGVADKKEGKVTDP